MSLPTGGRSSSSARRRDERDAARIEIEVTTRRSVERTVDSVAEDCSPASERCADSAAKGCPPRVEPLRNIGRERAARRISIRGDGSPRAAGGWH
jgi:hypothetical protein